MVEKSIKIFKIILFFFHCILKSKKLLFLLKVHPPDKKKTFQLRKIYWDVVKCGIPE